MGRQILEGSPDGYPVYRLQSAEELSKVVDELGIGKKDLLTSPEGAQINDIDVLILNRDDIPKLEQAIADSGVFEELEEIEKRYKGLGGRCKISCWDGASQKYVEAPGEFEFEEDFLLNYAVNRFHENINDDDYFWFMCASLHSYMLENKKDIYKFFKVQ